MDILYSSFVYLPSLGGGEIHLHQIAKTLGQQGHRVRVVNQWSRSRSDWIYGATIRCDPPRKYVHDSVPVTQLGFDPATRKRMLPWVLGYRLKPLRRVAIRRISRLMSPYFIEAAGESIDVIHAQRCGPVFLARTAFEHSRDIGVPFVITALHHPDYTQPKHRHFARIFREADAVIALTSFEKRVLVEQMGVREERVHVTGIGPILAADYSVEDFREQHQLHRPYVLFVGRKESHKGWGAMLAAVPKVLRQVPDVDFVFVGPDTPASLAAFAAEESSRVHNLGQVDLETKTAALAGCELLCVPSTSESFCGVFTEAWAFDKPVIGGQIPPLQHVINDGVDGLLSSQDPDELADKLVWILSNPREALQMGASGRSKVEQRYSWDHLVQATLKIYESVL